MELQPVTAEKGDNEHACTHTDINADMQRDDFETHEQLIHAY